MQKYQTTSSGFALATVRSTLVTMQISSNCQKPISQQFEMNTSKFGKTAKGRDKKAKKPAGVSARSIKAMKAKLKSQKITISAMKAKFDIETDDPVTDDAGNLLGGSFMASEYGSLFK